MALIMIRVSSGGRTGRAVALGEKAKDIPFKNEMEVILPIQLLPGDFTVGVEYVSSGTPDVAPTGCLISKVSSGVRTNRLLKRYRYSCGQKPILQLR